MRFAIIFLALLGIVDSALALKVHYDDPGKEPCSINDKWDCGVVNHSPYAIMLGVPVAMMGMLGYLLIAILAWRRKQGLLIAAVMTGLAFALYLTHIEAHILGVWCLYCVISQGLIAVLAVLSLIWIAITRPRRPVTA